MLRPARFVIVFAFLLMWRVCAVRFLVCCQWLVYSIFVFIVNKFDGEVQLACLFYWKSSVVCVSEDEILVN